LAARVLRLTALLPVAVLVFLLFFLDFFPIFPLRDRPPRELLLPVPVVLVPLWPRFAAAARFRR
jgi:hypothetical protein